MLTAGLTQVTERLQFLVAFRPGLQSPTLSAQQAATYQRISGGRLLLNVVTGGDDAEQWRFGDHVGKRERYARAAEFLHIVRELWTRGDGQLRGRVLRHPRGAARRPAASGPTIYLGGSSPEAPGGRGPARRRLPDVGRAAGAGRREARSRPRGRREAVPTEPRAALRHPPPRDHARHLRGGMGRGGPPSGRPGPRADRPRPGGPARVAVRGPAADDRAARRAHRRSWRSPPTCGPASAWSAEAPARRWSAATTRSPTASRSTTTSASTSSSSPAIRTWRRPTAWARASCPSCAAAA